MSADRERKAATIRRLLDTEGDSVYENVTGFNEGRYESTADLEDYEQLRDEARTIKEDAIERLPELLSELTAAVEDNGGSVYLAEDEADANQYITRVASAHDAETVVKSKSMTSEELAVNDALEAAGLTVWETDLGEFVLQVADEAPSHIVAPAIHRSREEIAELFNKVFEPKERLETATELTEFAREYLGERMLDADLGMTGANFIAADTGTIALVTSEGNARKTVQGTDVHVAVAGVEKVVPSVSDLAPFVELIGRSGTGQDITSYISLFTPPTDSPTFDGEPLSAGGGDREFHLVLVDNGRMAMRDDELLRETLYCIRCSACANVCANFQHVGGHAFGGETYSGGIATGWEAGVHGLEATEAFNDLCTSCSRCADVCPVRIDIPWINEVVRDRRNRAGGQTGDLDWVVEGLTPDAEPAGVDLQKRLFGNFETIARVGSALAPVSNWVGALGPVRQVMERVLGVDRRRDLPQFARETFRDWFEARTAPTEFTQEVVLYPDLYTQYLRPERGRAAVRTLEALGCRVIVPDVRSSGRAPLSQGMIRTAREHARAVYGALAEHVDVGRPIVVIEPSDLAMFERDYEHLLPERSVERLSAQAVDVMEFVLERLKGDADRQTLAGPEAIGSAEIAFHSNCQQRTIHREDATVAVLDRLGFDVVESDVECCGMAGSFGYKQEYYELSMDVGEVLREQLGDPAARDRLVVASGTSCQSQLSALLQRPNQHPIELVDPLHCS